MNSVLQCQREAARFASGPDRVEELTRIGRQAAIRHLLAGDRPAALQAMYDGQKAACPLTFTPPAVTR